MLCLNYEIGWDPRIWVIEPDFTQLDILPHVYKHHSNRLCLYKPSNFNWTSDKNIVQTIILWAFCWIEFYEGWKDNGKWYGEEADHTKPTDIIIDNNTVLNTTNKKSSVKSHYPKYLKDYPIRL